jgi:bifunctional DNase/RNase
VPALPAPEGELVEAELATVGWDALSGTPVVLLREQGTGQVLPIWIGVAEARAIAQALHGIEPPRPQTHDLMAGLLEHLGATLEEVVVTELREGTYYGLLKLSVDGDDSARWVDTRPSDGLALALRTGARILVAAELLEDQPDFQFLAPELPEQVVRVLGLTVRAVTPELRQEHGLPERDGLVVVAVSGEAERQGLERGDLIVDVDGVTPREPLDLLAAIRDATGSVLKLTYWRDGEERTVELEIDVDPSSRRKKGKVA